MSSEQKSLVEKLLATLEEMKQLREKNNNLSIRLAQTNELVKLKCAFHEAEEAGVPFDVLAYIQKRRQALREE